MKLLGETSGSTPIFSIPTEKLTGWNEVWGSAYLQKESKWAFPGYSPFAAWALRDLKTVDPKLEFDLTSKRYIEQAEGMVALWNNSEKEYEQGLEVNLPTPENYNYHTYPLFAHQRLGIAKTYAYYRAMLLWEMGTGKTRVMIELLRLLKRLGAFKRALVVCPTVVLPTWEAQTEMFSKGDLKTLDITRGNRQKKLAEANQADIVLTTYGVVRTEAKYAYNQLLPEGYKVTGVVTDNALKRVLAEIAKVDNNLYTHTLQKLNSIIPISNLYKLIDYDVIIFDEGHVVGNWESETTRAAMQLSSKASRRYILTGTPGDNPLKFYSLLRLLHPWLERRSFFKFKEHHVVQDKLNPYLVVGWKNMDEINSKIDLISSRMKKDECLDLPPVLISDVIISLGPKQKSRYNEIVQDMRATENVTKRHLPVVDDLSLSEDLKEEEPVPDRVVLKHMHGAIRVNKLLQVTSGFLIIEPDPSVCNGCQHLEVCVNENINPYTSRCKVVKKAPPREILRDTENVKISVFEDLVENILDSNPTNKVIIWCIYSPELDDLEKVCNDRKWDYVRVDGKTTKKIKSIEDKFQNDEKCRIYLGQVDSGVGITLTAANYTIYYSLPWDRKTYRQSFDRNNRAGQTRKITVYRLICKDTLNEFVSKTLNYKDHLAFTLSEKIKCAACDQQARCGEEEIRPFQNGCKYQANADRLVAKPESV